MDATDIIVLGRVVERLLIVASGGLSLILGWHLFIRNITLEQSGELISGTLSIKLLKVGPGIFFALFGSVILGISISNTASIKQPENRHENNPTIPLPTFKPDINYFGKIDSNNLRIQTIATLNSTLELLSPNVINNPSVLQVELDSLSEAREQIVHIKDQWITTIEGTDSMELWNLHKDQFAQNPASLREVVRLPLSKVQLLMNTAITDDRYRE
jgi:hypothetical protein